MEGGQKWDGEQEGEQEGETNRMMEELQKLISSSPEHGSLDHDLESVAGTSFPELGHLNFGTNMNTRQPEPYHEKLRSYSSFSISSALSDTSSQCTNNDMMEMTYDQAEHSFSDGGGAGHRRSLRLQPRQRYGKGRAYPEFSDSVTGPSRRSYECGICEQKFPSPQSLGGHRNLHRSDRGRGKGSGSGSRRRHRGLVPVVQTGGSGSNSSESESVASIYKGVRCREGGKWVTEIRPPKSPDKWWLGSFDSAEEAAQAYDVALVYFKSESELNFGYHPLYEDLPKLDLQSDLSRTNFAQALRDMVKEFSEKIIAKRRLQEQATHSASLPAVAPAVASSSDSAPRTLQDPPPPQPPFDLPREWEDQWFNDLDRLNPK